MIRREAFLKYLKDKNILVDETINSHIKANNVDETKLEEQFYIINDFHKRVMGYENIKDRLDSGIGKTIEEYKVCIKKVNRDLKKIKLEGPNNAFENKFLELGEEHIEKGKKAIKNIYKNEYYSLITRSMKNKEIILDKVDFKHLKKEDEFIKLKTINKCKYNLVEMDCFYLLYRYKKKGVSLDYYMLIDKFCSIANLGENSYQFILSLLSFPYEFMKVIMNYRYNRKNLSEHEYLLDLIKSSEQKNLISI
ncbi:spore coat protein [Clostridium cochlearium]|uniref:Spore coat protein n=1 Tax=Clostridium cochlearium TaxID=1494 RepID=A0A7Y3XZ75_CLOCO|nr:spore coat protein [Clostridium cochlearium]NOH16586.1 spore coat protein [Clostridium cochlearium]